MPKNISAGLLNYRFDADGNLEVLLVKSGGPYWKNTIRAWGIPKGMSETGEDAMTAARREFEEETGLSVPADVLMADLGHANVRGKHVLIWAFEHDYGNFKIISNKCTVEYPMNSGIMLEIDECDDGRYFKIRTAYDMIFKYQTCFLERLVKQIKGVT